MTINDYQKEALRTAPTWWPNPFEPLKNGQAIDILKKQLFQGHPLDREHLAKELGDVAWCLAVSAAALGYTLEEILVNNRPGVDAEPVRRAQWEAENRRGTLCDTYVCSKCGNMVMQAEGYTYSCIYNYCPNCGAKMDAKEEQQ